MPNKTKNKKKTKRTKRVIRPRISRRPKLTGESKALTNFLTQKIKLARPPRMMPTSVARPILNHISRLLYPGHSCYYQPLSPTKDFYAVVRYQDTLTVNSSGNLAVIGSIPGLNGQSSTSTVSPICYFNNTLYSPTATSTQTTSGYFNLTALSASALNFDTSVFNTSEIIAAHVTVSFTGMNIMNRSGTLHAFADNDETFYRGDNTASSSGQANSLVNTYMIDVLPKVTHYRKYDLCNIGTDLKVTYSFVPPLPYATGQMYSITTSTSIVTVTNPKNQNFGFIVQGAAATTVMRVEYEIHYRADPVNNQINTHPVYWTDCLVNPDQYHTLISMSTDNIISDKKKSDSSQYHPILKAISNQQEQVLFDRPYSDFTGAKAPQLNNTGSNYRSYPKSTNSRSTFVQY